MGVLQGIVALGHAELAEIFAGGAEFAHVMVGQEGETGVRPARAIGVDGVVGELAEAGDGLAEAVDMVGIAGNAGDDLGIARLDRTRGPA